MRCRSVASKRTSSRADHLVKSAAPLLDERDDFVAMYELIGRGCADDHGDIDRRRGDPREGREAA